MIKYHNGEVVDPRHTVEIYNSISFAKAIQLTKYGTYEGVTYMTDDERTWDNEAIIDATEEELEAYRKFKKEFKR